jgi:hypothetical protein
LDTTTQLAANIAQAINLNAVPVTASSSGNVITVTANAPGSAGDYGLSVANLNFTWSPTSAMSGGATGARVQPNMYPATYSSSYPSASCSDFVVYPTGTAGGTGAASIVAFNNLYAGSGSCIAAGASPPTYWAYNTGGMVTTSPVLSIDGTQVAFVQVSSSNTASLVVLTWQAGNGTPTLPVSPATPSTYLGCTAPCMVTLAFGNGKNDTYSAPFYDYDSDTIWVGDDSGNLHQFTGIFRGAPAEVTTTPWPLNVSANKLAPPTYDFGTGRVIVGDLGGVLHSVTAATGAVYGTSTQLGNAIVDAPLLDSSAGLLYVFVDKGVSCYTTSNVMYQFSTGSTGSYLGCLALGSVGGTGVAGYYVYSGTFDNLYYSSYPPMGNIYVVADTGAPATRGATLNQIPVLGTGSYTVSGTTTSGSKTVTITTGTVQSVLGNSSTTITGGGIPSGDTIASASGSSITLTTAANGSHTNETLTIGITVGGIFGPYSPVTGGLTVKAAGAYPWPSPITEFCNNGTSACTVSGGETSGGTDYIFFSVNQGTSTGCSASAGHGCILSYNISNPSLVAISGSGLPVTTPGSNGCWATSGITIDNGGSLTGADQIYFIGLSTNAAGGPTGTTQTSTNCTAGTATTVGATQASQANP